MIRLAALAFIFLAALALGGCNGERSQAAADARAGIAAAKAHADATGQAILSGVDARLPAAAGTNSAKWPAPKMTPAAIEKDPPLYLKTAPPEPANKWLHILGLASAIGLPLLYAIGRVAPMVPGLGTAAGTVANLAWTLLSHRDQKAAERARDTVADASGNLLPIAQAANATPEVLAALKVLAAT